MEKTAVLIVDDHAVVRVGLEYMVGLSPSLQVAGCAGGGLEALEKVRALRPAVVLMDLGMPDMDGLEATRRIKAEFPQTRVVVMTMHDDDLHVAEAVQAGVDGYLLKTAAPEEVCRAIESAARGEMTMKTALFQRALGRMLGSSASGRREPTAGIPTPGRSRLTAREISVLRLLARGMTNKEIAGELTIAPGTAKRHVESILAKLEAADRTDAAAIAVRLRLVE